MSESLYIRSHLLWILVGVLQLTGNTYSQHTVLDDLFARSVRHLRERSYPILGYTSEDPDNLRLLSQNGKTQQSHSPRFSGSETICPDPTYRKRSDQPPTSVHRLRPGDIDIIGAVGDSLTAGNSIYSTNALHAAVENRGRSATGGGEGTWRDQLTLANVLKEFNPQLYGYATRDGLSWYRSTRFNVGETGAMSRDMPYMARVLVKRLRSDPRVNMTGHWKLITHFIGGNDFCVDMCFYDSPRSVVQRHEADLVDTLRYLRDHVPRVLVNLIVAPNIGLYRDLSGLPPNCRLLRPYACPCLIGGRKSQAQLREYQDIIDRWQRLDVEVANRPEFNTDTFAVVTSPVFALERFPEDRNGNKITTLLAEDCFHFSAYGQANVANALWNNLLRKPTEKRSFNIKELGKFECPSERRPYIVTPVNSREDFVP